jgi:16S rRNA (adenine1518-N6/adenine1519-N6)-dimethyltransferase
MIPMKHKARKRFGQNFLHDDHIIEAIVATINPAKNDHLVEIGPGQGALTSALVANCQRLDAIELDRDLLTLLLASFSIYPCFHLHNQDALKTDYQALYQGTPLRVVGNLPYNISTPLILRLFEFAPIIQDMHFMLQSEVVDRLTAVPHTKAWGRLGILAQYLCHVERVLDVPPEAFDPPPKVQSAVVKLTPKPVEQIDKSQLERLQILVKQAFSQRRKTLRNTLKGWVDDHELERFGIDPSSRAETISLDQWIQLSDGIEQ